MSLIIFSDLIDVPFEFICEDISETSTHWKYDFHIKTCGEEYIKSLDNIDILQLRKNCENILKAINDAQGGCYELSRNV